MISILTDKLDYNVNSSSNGASQLPPASNGVSAISVTEAGLKIYPPNLAKLNDHAVSVTYTISTEPSAEKQTYIITNFYGICPGELLTVGEVPNELSLEWAKGPFYGCSG